MNDPAHACRKKLFLVIALTLLLAGMLLLHAPFLNGPYYWKWPWRRLEALRYFPAMAACAIPLVVALLIPRKTGFRTALAIGLVMLSMLAAQIVHIGMTVKPFSLSRIIYFVQSPMSMSYFADADRSIDVPLLDLLAHYSGYMPQFFMHSQEKPPGPILFFRVILQWLGPSDRTALVAGLMVGVLATLGIPSTYALIRVLLRDPDAAFLGAAMLSLCPGLTLMFPMLDQVYPAMTCPVIIAWVVALRTRKVGWAMGYGAILAAVCFVVYHFLVLGAFLAAATFVFVYPAARERIGVVARLTAVAAATFVAIYLVLYVLTGFNFIATFSTALVEQGKHLDALIRPWPRTIVFDLTDFTLGVAWIPVLLAILLLFNRKIDRETRGWGALCIGQLILLALIGLMQAETARIWAFLMPLLMLPAGAELSRWPRGAQWTVFASIWLLMALVGQNLTFMY